MKTISLQPAGPVSDHTALSNIGTNSHAAIDTHIADATIHFTEGSIDHGSIGGLAGDDHTQYHTDARALTWLGTRSTTDLSEGTNLYYTNERVDDQVAALVTDTASVTWSYNDGAGTLEATAVAGGIDHGALAGLADDDHTQYHTDARALTWLGTRSTSDLAEGTNLYFTDERVDDRVGALVTNTASVSWTYNDVANTLEATVLPAGVDHGGLGGLTDDDHTQYHTDARALTWLGTRSTTDLPEGTNLYHTQERVEDVVGALATDSASVDFTYDDGAGTLTAVVLPAGVDHGGLAGLADDDHSQYHTDARALTWLGTRSTSDLPEGTNLYFTDERVDDRVGALVTDTASVTWTYNDVANTLEATAVAGGIDHGALAGLADDDHPQYLLADGSRALTAAWDVGDFDILNVNELGVGTGTLSNASLLAEFVSTSQGVLLPVMTEAQRDLISPAPPNGTLIFNSDVGTIGRYQMRGTSGWRTLALVGEGGNANMIVGVLGSTTEQGMLTVNANSAGDITSRGTSPTVNACSLVLEQQGGGDCGLYWLLPGVSEWVAYIDNSDGDDWKLRNITTSRDIIVIDNAADDQLLFLGSAGSSDVGVNGSITCTGPNATILIQPDSPGSAELTLAAGTRFANFSLDIATAPDQLRIEDSVNGTTPVIIEWAALGTPDNSFTIGEDGNVGVGALGVDEALVVYRNSASDAYVEVENDGTGDAGLQLTATGAQEWQLFLDNSDTDNLVFRDATAGANVATIEAGAPANSLFVETSTGDVGIGTASPTQALHVRRATGNVSILVQSVAATTSADLRMTTSTQDYSIGLGASNLFALTDFTALTIPFAIEAAAPTLAFYIKGTTGFTGFGTNAPTSKLDVRGSISLETRTVTASATAGDESVIFCNSASAITITLPAASGVTNRVYEIKNINTGAVTVDGNGSETIDDNTTVILASQYDSITIVCDGTEWWIV